MIKIKNKIKSLALKGIAGLIGFMPLAQSANALDGNVEYILSENNEASYARANGFYTLPENVDGFSYMELYKDGGGYFGETTLGKEITKGFNAKIQLQHANTPLNRFGLGISRQIPTPKNTFLNLTLYPVWFDKEGKQEKTSELAYFASADLPFGFKASSFGDFNLAADGGARWDYGEASLSKKVGPITLSYNPCLLSKENSKLIPSVQHRISAGINF